MFTTILIPVDMAHMEKGPELIDVAKQVSGEGARFVLANIVQNVPQMAEMGIPVEYFERSRTEAKEALQKLAQENAIEATFLVEVGHVANSILEMSEHTKADLILIGSHSPGFQDYLIGSTASRVVRHAKCPVLIMR